MPKPRCFSHLSAHAGLRTLQRTSLTDREVLALLDGGACVHVGTIPALGKRHLLFYSQKDDCCFVAVQDGTRGTVITVLPLAYHENLAWAVTPAQCDKAKTLALEAAARGMEQLDPGPSRLVVTMHVLEHSGRERLMRAGTTCSSEYGEDIEAFTRSGAPLRMAAECAFSAGIPFARVSCLSVRLGRHQNAVPRYIEHPDLASFSQAPEIADALA